MEAKALDGKHFGWRLSKASQDGGEGFDEWLRGGGAEVDSP